MVERFQMPRRKIEDRKIILALIQSDSIRGASELCKVSETTIYNRFNDSDFVSRLEEEKSKIFQFATFRIQCLINRQIDILSDIANNTENSPQVRINASETLLRYSVRLTEQMDIKSRLDRLENFLNEQGDLI